MLMAVYACVCHRGKVRRINQDNLVWEKQFLPMGDEGLAGIVCGALPLERTLLFGVFDGMGGEQRGEAASWIAAGTAAEWDATDDREEIRKLCREMNRRICEFAAGNGLSSCGTTAAMLLVDGKKAIGCNLGDSRIYYLRNGFLTQLSEDHVYPVYASGKPPLLQYLGIPESEMSIEPSLFSKEIRTGDMILICSDGLTDMVDEDRILRVLMPAGSLEDKAEALLDAALSAGGRDNITIILVEINR